MADLAQEVLKRLGEKTLDIQDWVIDTLEVQEWRSALYWSKTRNMWSTEEDTNDHRRGNWYQLLGVAWGSQDQSVSLN